MRMVGIPGTRIEVPLLAEMEVGIGAAVLWPTPPWRFDLHLPGFRPWVLPLAVPMQDIPAAGGVKTALVARPEGAPPLAGPADPRPMLPIVRLYSARGFMVCRGPAIAEALGPLRAGASVAVCFRMAEEWRQMTREQRQRLQG